MIQRGPKRWRHIVVIWAQSFDLFAQQEFRRFPHLVGPQCCNKICCSIGSRSTSNSSLASGNTSHSFFWIQTKRYKKYYLTSNTWLRLAEIWHPRSIAFLCFSIKMSSSQQIWHPQLGFMPIIIHVHPFPVKMLSSPRSGSSSPSSSHVASPAVVAAASW